MPWTANRRLVGVEVVTEGIGHCQPFVLLILQFVALSATPENSTNLRRYQRSIEIARCKEAKR